MSFQIVLVMETNEKSKSDYMYIRSILGRWYGLLSRNDIKISAVYMNGKGNYKNKCVIGKIDKYIKAYLNGRTHVVYCFDTDKYECNSKDKKCLLDEQAYCSALGYHFAWFCHDIEEVFLGESVSKNEKTERARNFVKSNGITKLKRVDFNAKKMSKKRSNLVTILDCIISQEREAIYAN